MAAVKKEKKEEEKGIENLENDENNINNMAKKNKNGNINVFGTIINIEETLNRYSTINTNEMNNNANNTNIPNSELILIILEICLNSSQFGIEKDNSSRAFWEEVGKIE